MPSATARRAAPRITLRLRWRHRPSCQPIRWATSSRAGPSAAPSSTAGAMTSGRCTQLRHMERVLLTGAGGKVGRQLRGLLKPVYPGLRLSDIARPPDLAADEPFVAADLAHLDQVEAAVDGVEGIVHLGGFSVEGPWETILQANII